MFKLILAFAAAAAASATFLPVGDDYCSADTNCPANSMCMNIPPCKLGIACMCDPGFEVYDRLSGVTRLVDCVAETVKVGDTCDFTAKFCLGQYTTCSLVNLALECVCWPGYTANADNTECIPPAVVKLGSSCTGLGTRCGYGAVCKSSKCECLPVYTGFNDTDCTHYDENEACNFKDDCDLDMCRFGSCDSGKFECITGMRWHKYDVDDNIIDGWCIPEHAKVIDVGGFCQDANGLKSDQLCRVGTTCGMCPETPMLTRCIGTHLYNDGEKEMPMPSGVEHMRMSVTAALLSLVVSLAVLRK